MYIEKCMEVLSTCLSKMFILHAESIEKNHRLGLSSKENVLSVMVHLAKSHQNVWFGWPFGEDKSAIAMPTKYSKSSSVQSLSYLLSKMVTLRYNTSTTPEDAAVLIVSSTTSAPESGCIERERQTFSANKRFRNNT